MRISMKIAKIRGKINSTQKGNKGEENVGHQEIFSELKSGSV